MTNTKHVTAKDMAALNVLFESYRPAQFQITISWVEGRYHVQAREWGQFTSTETGIGHTLAEAIENLDE